MLYSPTDAQKDVQIPFFPCLLSFSVFATLGTSRVLRVLFARRRGSQAVRLCLGFGGWPWWRLRRVLSTRQLLTTTLPASAILWLKVFKELVSTSVRPIDFRECCAFCCVCRLASWVWNPFTYALWTEPLSWCCGFGQAILSPWFSCVFGPGTGQGHWMIDNWPHRWNIHRCRGFCGPIKFLSRVLFH